MITHLTGVIPVVVTPFEPDGRIDYDSLERLIEEYCRGGISGIIVPAVASEVDKLTGPERFEMIERVLRVAASRVPIVGGVIEPTAKDVSHSVERLMNIGCEYVLCRAPESMANNPEKLKSYFLEAAKTGIEYLVIQDLSWGNYGMEVDLIRSLRDEISAFQCIKIEVARTGYKATVLHDKTGGALQVWSGWAMPQMIEALDRGIHGFNPSAFHRPYIAVIRHYLAGNRQRAAEIFEATLPYLAWSRQHIDINLHLLKRLCVRKNLFRYPHLRSPCIPWDDYHERYANELIERMIGWEQLR